MVWLPLGLCPRVLEYMGDEARARAHHFRYRLDEWKMEMRLMSDDGFYIDRTIHLTAIGEYRAGDMVEAVMRDMFNRLAQARERGE